MKTLRSDSTLKFIGIAVLRCEKELHGAGLWPAF
jgi:hypothetical protein